ncbi:GNAT family N-acetyltransferase [Alteribacter aurantiacus]|uniref:GNAT family N-acetyltransferase n=1 Tax=Alteribacter aurantiacus TaxID=254410 RepID=UPI0004251E5D|nr:GNAT family N-acetyltransferase [Alteribacter aurantiacus]
MEVNQIKVLEYEPIHAQHVAKMWNMSREGWGGHSDVKSKEHVRDQQANSSNLRTYLAMDGQEVVGYCGLSEYREDEGALYIPLLNVRTDYHGKKIGKKLLLTALDETIRRQWPRLDLYTWPGNTKAVPLYKKCGFFWENRDDTVHLMNFLPTVLSTELFAPFFQEVDWYEDSVREIKTEPDGEKVDGFDYYTYEWRKDEHRLSVDIEKTGRGIGCFKTSTLEVTMSIDSHDCVFGKEYPVTFIAKNTSSEPLAFSYSGRDNKNIRFSDQGEGTVMPGEEQRFTSEFFVMERSGEQKTMQTHPVVEAVVLVNGQSVVMKKGVLTKAPVTITGSVRGSRSFSHQKSEAYIQLENNSNSEVVITFELPASKVVTFEQYTFSVRLKKAEKRSIPVLYHLTEALFYHEFLNAKVTMENAEIDFKQPLTFLFNVTGQSCYGETTEYVHLFQGLSHVGVKKENNSVFIERGRSNKGDFTFHYPKVGLPYSEEFSKMEPKEVTFFEKGQTIGATLVYPSRDFPGLTLERIISLTADGIMTQRFGLINKSENPISGIKLNEPLKFDLSDTVLPYDNKFVQHKGTYFHEVNGWDSDKLTENWLFTTRKNLPAALIWDEKTKLHFHTWHIMYFEHDVEEISPDETVYTPVTTLSLGALLTVEEARQFAKQQVEPTPVVSASVMSWGTKNKNPFVKHTAHLLFNQRLNRSADAVLKAGIRHEGKISEDQWTSEEDRRSWETTLPILSVSQPTLADISIDLSGQLFKKTTALFPVSGKEVSTLVDTISERKTLILRNESVSIKIAPDFYPAVYSLTYKGKEWLDSTFPTPEPRSWWNPWIGGIRFELFNLSSRSVLKERVEAQFVRIKDELDNDWTGVAQQFTVKNQPRYKGVTATFYTFIMPGAPVVCTMYTIKQETGKLWKDEMAAIMFNIFTGSTVGDVVIQAGEDSCTYRHHTSEHQLDQFTHLVTSMKGRNEKLHVFPEQTNDNMELYTNQHVIAGDSRRAVELKDKGTFYSDPMFFLFSEEQVTPEAATDLRSIRFDYSTLRKD